MENEAEVLSRRIVRMGFKISPWHMEIARRIAQGQPNREIMKEIKISPSRLSVIKANPVFQRQVEKFRERENDRYNRALKVLGDEAESLAKELVKVGKGSVHTPQKLNAIVQALDRVAQAEGHTKESTQDEDELVFEQRLRVVKKAQMSGDTPDSPHDEDGQVQAAIKQLNEDLKDAISSPQR